MESQGQGRLPLLLFFRYLAVFFCWGVLPEQPDNVPVARKPANMKYEINFLKATEFNANIR
ncbi:hypothetical protein PKOR_02665 [Pontibacter korlensis]|uniref:Uncharacterized protein n=1 Tax=Pontibacter korlensis TaxID=400092 RepID=A0A0E3ZD68_9BACT|nr:hypothetical protein PKOR_02665 [Pontibacter korlensis]